MQIRNCSRCGKIFYSVGRKICPDCVQKEEEEYRKVRDYVREHKNATIPAVSEATGVPAERINQFIREGRLELVNAVLECMSCGAPIRKGRFCEKCLAEMSRPLGTSSKEKTPENERKSEWKGDGRAPRYYSIQQYFERRNR